MSRGRRAQFANAPVTVKLTAEEVAWLDAEVDRLRAGAPDGTCFGVVRWVSPTRSGVLRALVEAARRGPQGAP